MRTQSFCFYQGLTSERQKRNKLRIKNLNFERFLWKQLTALHILASSGDFLAPKVRNR